MTETELHLLLPKVTYNSSSKEIPYEPWDKYTVNMQFNNSSRPFGGTQFRIIKSPYPIDHFIIQEASKLIGQIGSVRAWCPCFHGVDLGIKIEGRKNEFHIRVPYFMLEPIEKKVS